MNMPYFLSSVQWESVIWILLGLAAGVALTAVLNPRLFSVLSTRSGVWIDIDVVTRKLDKRINIDRRVLPHSRLLGAMSIAAASVLAAFSIRYQYAGWWIVLTSLGVIAAIGLVALVSPRLFSRLATWGSVWVDTDRVLKKADHRIDIDAYVLRYCRLFGAGVLGVVVVLAALLICTL